MRYRVALEPAAAQGTDSSSTSISGEYQLNTVEAKGEITILFTIAVSSPGKMRNCSPICTTPLHNLPETAMPPDEALNRFDMGRRRGNSIFREGGSSLSSHSVSFEFISWIHMHKIPSKSASVGPLYQVFRPFASSPSLDPRFTPDNAATGTNSAFDGLNPVWVRNGLS